MQDDIETGQELWDALTGLPDRLERWKRAMENRDRKRQRAQRLFFAEARYLGTVRYILARLSQRINRNAPVG
jgi:hypothetical protein